MGAIISDQSNIAEDIATLFEGMSGANGALAGAQYLATVFEVEQYSLEFYEIVSAILGSLRHLEQIVDEVVTRERPRATAKTHIATLRSTFDQNGLQQQWNQFGAKRTANSVTDPILSLSHSLQAFDYTRPDDEEIEDFRADADELLKWLKEHQFEEQDFIRGCLIEGVERFLFRLDKLKWVGWGYAAESLREVVGAYLALERGVDPTTMPTANAGLKKIASKLKKPLSLISKGRGVKDDAEFMLTAYHASSQFVKPTLGYIAGLLTG